MLFSYSLTRRAYLVFAIIALLLTALNLSSCRIADARVVAATDIWVVSATDDSGWQWLKIPNYDCSGAIGIDIGGPAEEITDKFMSPKNCTFEFINDKVKLRERLVSHMLSVIATLDDPCVTDECIQIRLITERMRDLYLGGGDSTGIPLINENEVTRTKVLRTCSGIPVAGFSHPNYGELMQVRTAWGVVAYAYCNKLRR